MYDRDRERECTRLFIVSFNGLKVIFSLNYNCAINRLWMFLKLNFMHMLSLCFCYSYTCHYFSLSAFVLANCAFEDNIYFASVSFSATFCVLGILLLNMFSMYVYAGRHS